MPFDRKPIDLCWKVAHGVLYTAHRLVSFGLNVPPDCFCGHSIETLEHLFFYCPLDKSGLDWIQSLLFMSSPWHRLLLCVTCCSILVVTSCCVCPVSSAIFFPCLSFLFGAKEMTIVFGPSLQVLWVLSLVLRVVCPSTYPCFSSIFGLGAGAFSSSANGEPMVTLEKPSVAPFVFVFPSVV